MKFRQKGFSLVTAIFILLILALLGGYMVRLGATQRTTTLYAIQGARAYQAARAGIEWANAKIASDGNCNAVNGASLTFAGLNGFAVTLACSTQSFTESANVDVFTVSSTGEYGTYSDSDYASRRLEITLVD